MQLLNHEQIIRKTRRLAYEILENNYNESELILAGINNKGMKFGEFLKAALEAIDPGVAIQLTSIRLSPANPLERDITLGMPVESLKDRVVVVVDDVANTGRTMYYAVKPLLDVIPKKVEFAVLVDRKHKIFPIRVDYVGMTLATTFHEHVNVDFSDEVDAKVVIN